MSDARWRVADLVWFRGGGDTDFATPRRGRGVVEVPRPLAEIVRGLTRFRTLDEHVAACGVDPAQIAALRQDLNQLARSGVLISVERVRAAAAASQRTPAPAVDTVAIVTRERPLLVERALRQRIECDAPRKLTYAVFDDAAGDELRGRLSTLHSETGARLSYASRAAKAEFGRALAARCGTDPKVVEFALNGALGLRSDGANRNAARLHGAGLSVAFMDDDVTGASARLAPADEVALSSAADPTEFHFFGRDEHAASFAGVGVRDLLAEHERWLGRSLDQCNADLDEGSAWLLSFAESAYVAVTTDGLAGDSGMASAGYYLLLGGESRARLVADYPAQRLTRSVVRAATRTTLSEGIFFMSPSFCLDEREPLPPFFPIQRNSDAVFVAMLRALHPHALVCHLPTAVEHLPEEARAFDETSHAFGGHHLFTSDVLLWAVNAWTAPVWSLGARAASFQRHLRELGSLAPGGFADFLRLQRLAHLSRVSQALHEQLVRHDDCPPWRDDVQRALREVRRAMAGPAELTLVDLPGPDSALVMQHLLLRYADLLEVWPALLHAARELREQGTSPARPV